MVGLSCYKFSGHIGIRTLHSTRDYVLNRTELADISTATNSLCPNFQPLGPKKFTFTFAKSTLLNSKTLKKLSRCPSGTLKMNMRLSSSLQVTAEYLVLSEYVVVITVKAAGFEPATHGLKGPCFTVEATPPY
jgi:hypothetical protein